MNKYVILAYEGLCKNNFDYKKNFKHNQNFIIIIIIIIQIKKTPNVVGLIDV